MVLFSIFFFFCFYNIFTSAKDNDVNKTALKFSSNHRKLGILDLINLAQKRIISAPILHPQLLGTGLSSPVYERGFDHAHNYVNVPISYNNPYLQMDTNNNILNQGYYSNNPYNMSQIYSGIRTLETINDPNKPFTQQNIVSNLLNSKEAYSANYNSKADRIIGLNENNLYNYDLYPYKYGNASNEGNFDSVYQNYYFPRSAENMPNYKILHLNSYHKDGNITKKYEKDSFNHILTSNNEKTKEITMPKKNYITNENHTEAKVDEAEYEEKESTLITKNMKSSDFATTTDGTSPEIARIQETLSETESPIEASKTINPEAMTVDALSTDIFVASDETSSAYKSDVQTSVTTISTIATILNAPSEISASRPVVFNNERNSNLYTQDLLQNNNIFPAKKFNNNILNSTNNLVYGSYNPYAVDRKFLDQRTMSNIYPNVIDNNSIIPPSMYQNVIVGGQQINPSLIPVYASQVPIPTSPKLINLNLGQEMINPLGAILDVRNPLTGNSNKLIEGAQDLNNRIYYGSKKLTSWLNDLSNYRKQNKDDTLVQLLDKIEEATKLGNADSTAKKKSDILNTTKNDLNKGGANDNNLNQEQQLQDVSALLKAGLSLPLLYTGAQQLFNGAINPGLSSINNKSFSTVDTHQLYKQQKDQQYNNVQKVDQKPFSIQQYNQAAQDNQLKINHNIHFPLDRTAQKYPTPQKNVNEQKNYIYTPDDNKMHESEVKKNTQTYLVEVDEQNTLDKQQLPMQRSLTKRKLQDSYLGVEIDDANKRNKLTQSKDAQKAMEAKSQQNMYYRAQPQQQYYEEELSLQKQNCFRENLKIDGRCLLVTFSNIVQACQAQCQGILACKVFYFRPEEKMCYLYDKANQFVIDAGSISGPKFCPHNTKNGYYNQIVQPVVNSNYSGKLSGMEVANDNDLYKNLKNVENLQPPNNLLNGVFDTIGVGQTNLNKLYGNGVESTLTAQKSTGALGPSLGGPGLHGSISTARDFFKASQALMEAGSTLMSSLPITQLWQAGQNLSGSGFFRNKGITTFNNGLDKQNFAPPPGVGTPTSICAAEGMTCCVPEKTVSDWKSKPPYLNGKNSNPICRAHFVSIQNALCATTSYDDEQCDIIKTETEDYIIYYHQLVVPSKTMNNAICICSIPKKENDEGLKQIEGFSTWEYSKQALTAIEEQSKMGEKLAKGLGTAMVFGNMLNQQGSQVINDIDSIVSNSGTSRNSGGNFVNGITSMVDAITSAANVAEAVGVVGSAENLNSAKLNDNKSERSKGSLDMSPKNSKIINPGNLSGGGARNDFLGSFVNAGDMIKNNARVAQRRQQFGLK